MWYFVRMWYDIIMNIVPLFVRCSMSIQNISRLLAISMITYQIKECCKSSWNDQSASWWESASRANYQRKDECSSVAGGKVAKWQLMITKLMLSSNKTRRRNWKNKIKQSNNKSKPSIFLSWTRSRPIHNIRATIFVFTHKIRATTYVPALSCYLKPFVFQWMVNFRRNK